MYFSFQSSFYVSNTPKNPNVQMYYKIRNETAIERFPCTSPRYAVPQNPTIVRPYSKLIIVRCVCVCICIL